MDVKALLQKHQYRLAGKHSAVKICTWTKHSIRGKGVCYKQKFYGINSHRCVQMSPAVGYCQNRCVFCWRPIEATEGIKMQDFDEPVDVIRPCLEGQQELLTGFGGNDKADKQKLEESKAPLHFAISLTGEPTLYPKLNELITLLHEKGYSTFVVSNGMEPGVLAKLVVPTQLYLSVDAPNEELFRKIDQPHYKDGWQRLQQSLEIIRRHQSRTCLRFTMIKGLNMVHPEQWAAIIEQAKPMFVEVKAYMHVGFSKKRLKMENMPQHSEIVDFARQIIEHCSYRQIDEHSRSRVVLLMEKDRDDRIMKF